MKDNYYDPTFHGVDLEPKLKSAKGDLILTHASLVGLGLDPAEAGALFPR